MQEDTVKTGACFAGGIKTNKQTKQQSTLWKQAELAGPYRDQITIELLLLCLLMLEYPGCADNPEA